MTIVKIGDKPNRPPRAGRIRTGYSVPVTKGGKTYKQPRTLNTFRFTSSDPTLLEPLAAKYHGIIKPWNEPRSPDTHEVTTEASKIAVVIPPDPISQSNELWDPHLKRVCNGPGGTCRLLVETQDDAEFQEVPCICGRKGIAECRYKLRLNVVLPETASIGYWRWDSSSEIAGEEMPGVADLIEELSVRRGFNRGVLRLEQRAGRNKRYPVVVLDLDASIEELMAGTTRLGSLPVAPPVTAGELVSGGGTGGGSHTPASPPVPPSTDDEIVDAELVDDPADSKDEPEHVEPMFGRATLDALPQKQKNWALRRGRELSAEFAEPVPTSIAAFSERVVDHLIDELELQRAGET